MDFLASLSLTNVPEQQTRTSHNPEIIEALSSNPNIQLGFDACCYCGKSIEESEAISCPKCKRVSYCSDRCRKLDSQPSSSYLQEEFDTEAPPSNANGHGSVICALLRLCNQDEDEEEAMEQENPKFNLSDKNKNKNKKTTSRKQEEARDRVRSEYESYPATLANLLMDGPCYQPMLQKCSASTKNNHSHNNGNGNGGDSEGLSLTIHIIGASNEAELWNANANASANGRKKALSRVFDSYAEALTDLAENYSIPSINLVFVGPDCPEKLRASRTLKLSSTSTSEKTKQQKKKSLSESRLSFYTHASMYNASFLQQLSSENENENLSKPDVIVFFNPGFTCPDYNWEDVLQNLPSKKNSSSTPFLITTNTEMEAVLDCQYLLERQCISSLPPMIQAMIDAETGDMNESDKSPGHYDNDNDNDIEEEEDGENYVESNDGMFFGENPYAGSRVRQSGTMANDVYVKSMWMFGGASLSPMVTASKPQKKRKESSAKKSNSQNNGGDSKEQDEEIRHEKKKRKKTHKVIGKGNSKKKNPALL